MKENLEKKNGHTEFWRETTAEERPLICLCSVDLAVKLYFNISKMVY